MVRGFFGLFVNCDEPLSPRDWGFVLKYFMLGRPVSKPATAIFKSGQ